MSPRRAITSGEDTIAPIENRTVNNDHLKLVERTIESLKAEAAAGTPVDREQIAEFERYLNKLRRTIGG
jgi:hypothetical protein